MKLFNGPEETHGIMKAIQRSQHCQRNFDMTKELPAEHIDLLKVAASECPSKQNIAFYKLHFITDRELIEKIHELTPTEKVHDLSQGTTNSQTLANLLIVFERYMDMSGDSDQHRNDETTRLFAKGEQDSKAMEILDRDANVAVGIAAGYLNLTASLMGYKTGCCQCMDQEGIKELLGLEDRPLLLMGIGFNDDSRPRRQHATDDTYTFPTRPKQKIPFQHWPNQASATAKANS